MSTNSCLLQLGTVEVLVVRKAIRNLHLAVLPPDGRVRVSSPLHLNDDAIRTLIATRIPWIRTQKTKFAAQARQAPREYISGESHFFLGKQYRLEVLHGDQSQIRLKGKNKIVLQVRSNSTMERREAVLMDWYRKELKTVSASMMETWQEKIGVRVESWGIKRMKTRWGTCNRDGGRIWLNLELVKKPVTCIEYVVVHELLHLIEKRHNEKFVGLLTT